MDYKVKGVNRRDRCKRTWTKQVAEADMRNLKIEMKVF